MKRTIAILRDPHEDGGAVRYTIDHFASIWREDGHEVFYLLGADRFVPADLVIVHVDLSVVPDEYIALARRYPIALNAGVTDIRKETFSTLRLTRDDAHAGRVIVKTNRNYAAIPEQLVGLRGPTAVSFRSPQEYRIYDRIDDVAPAIWDDPELIVEKFVPEMEGDSYVVHAMNFLGDRITCGRLVGPHPIVNGKTQERIERIEPHREMIRLRAQMGFDFGKFDYVMHEGRPILLDANKTVGAGNIPMTPERAKTRRYRAEGLYAYFNGGVR